MRRWIDNVREARKTAEAYHAAIGEASAHLSDETAKALPQSAFKQWEADMNYTTVGEIVVYNGITFRIAQPHTSQDNWLPTDVPALYDRFATVDVGGEEIEIWEQTFAHNSYMTGKRVLYNGKVYESLIDNNSFSPDAYPAGWKLIE